MKIKCPNCKRTDFVTTDKYTPDVTPNGSMVKSTLPYQIDWLCTSTTGSAEMTCPECLTPLVANGKFTFVPLTAEETEAEEVKKLKKLEAESQKFICDICGKEAKNMLGLNSHKRSHTGEPPYAKVIPKEENNTNK